jgi:predicted enzyme related to lactoylglutathione lyase
MTGSEHRAGRIVWTDLTVPDADAIRAFYEAVVGWGSSPQDGDFNMLAPGSPEPTTGICYARGPNRNLPAQWLTYVVVEDLDQSLTTCVALGGTIVDGPRSVGPNRFAVIRDPAGAVLALFLPAGPK